MYRLLTAGTYEAHMYAVATAKLSLDRAVLDGMASANAGNRHLHESLLKQGAGAVSFKPHAVNKELDGDDDEDAKVLFCVPFHAIDVVSIFFDFGPIRITRSPRRDLHGSRR